MKKILIVDDDRTLRAALMRCLQNRGYAVQEADSGSAGLASFEADPADLVISDVMMPQMNGLEFCRRLRELRAGQLVPFLFLSSKDELDDRIQGHQTGADDYLRKPVETRELLAKIEAQLERSHRLHSEIVRMMQQVEQSAIASVTAAQSEPPEKLPLTPAEEKVFWEVLQGFTNKQIGDRLFLSPRTVQTHLSNILSKFELENRSQLIRFAFERGYRREA
jgi:DNA-binding NarL/FixJ family response regulator